MSRLFGVAGVQMEVAPWNADATIDRMAEVAGQIARSFPWVRMIIFHELVVPGLVQFVRAPRPDTWKQSAEAIPGPLTERLSNLARETGRWLVPGSLYEADGEAIHNTALAIAPDGSIAARYRKMFPWLPYEAGTTPGTEFVTFDVPGAGRFGLCICYDMWFPEVCRTLVWKGAEVILQPTLTPTSDRPLELVMCQANALFNQCYFLSVNGTGPWGGGRSSFVDPDGRVLQTAPDNPTILTEILDLDHVTRTREYGTLGLGQTLKQLRDSGVRFPIYDEGVAAGEGFRRLGKLGFHGDLQ
jgi:formamidase